MFYFGLKHILVRSGINHTFHFLLRKTTEITEGGEASSTYQVSNCKFYYIISRKERDEIIDYDAIFTLKAVVDKTGLLTIFPTKSK